MRKVKNVPIWGESKPQLDALNGPQIADVVVVGLGGSGLTAIVEAARRGLSVIGIDAGCIGGAAAGRNGGFLMAGLSIPYDQAVTYLGHRRAREWYSATLDELGRDLHKFESIMNPSGSLTLASNEEELAVIEAEFAALQNDDFPVLWYTGHDGQGFIAQHDMSFNPLLRCQYLAQEALDLGVRLAENTPAIEISENVVRFPNGEIDARAIIVAVDGNLEKVLPQLAPRVRSTRLQMVCTAPLPLGLIPYPTYARSGYDYYLQLPTGEVALGGRRDRHFDSEWGAPAETSEELQGELDELIAKLTLGKGEITNRWAGVVSYSPDHLPICERTEPTIFVSGAYSGLGNVMGTLCARALVNHIFGENRLFDIVRSDVRTTSAGELAHDTSWAETA